MRNGSRNPRDVIIWPRVLPRTTVTTSIVIILQTIRPGNQIIVQQIQTSVFLKYLLHLLGNG